MTDNLHNNPVSAPSSSQLLKATLGSICIAALLLVTTVLPAEYGIDPTGLGKALGLMQLNEATPETAAELSTEPAANNLQASDVESENLLKAATELRSDTLKIPLMPGQGAEIKSRMMPGNHFVFTWQVEGGRVSFDMHGERPNSGGAFTSFWLGDDTQQSSGAFTAPFEGTHGWYWENKGDTPVTVVLQTHGFYGDLYMP